MKETPAQFTSILDAILQHQRRPGKTDHQVPAKERYTRSERKEFFYYMQVIDHKTKGLVGHLTDIGTGGFRLDCPSPIPVNTDFQLSITLPGEMANKPSIEFVACSKWCKIDPLDPYVYNVGFQLVHISPEDFAIFTRMMEKYGRSHENRKLDLRRSNKW